MRVAAMRNRHRRRYGARRRQLRAITIVRPSPRIGDPRGSGNEEMRRLRATRRLQAQYISACSTRRRWSRTFQCLDCDRPDPLVSKNHKRWLEGDLGAARFRLRPDQLAASLSDPVVWIEQRLAFRKKSSKTPGPNRFIRLVIRVLNGRNPSVFGVKRAVDVLQPN